MGRVLERQVSDANNDGATRADKVRSPVRGV